MTTIPNPPTDNDLPLSTTVQSSDRRRLNPLSAVEKDSPSALVAAIDHYRHAITTLQQTDRPSSEKLLDVRIARDAICTLNLELSQPINAKLRQQIKQLDRQFKREIERFKATYKKQAIKRRKQETIHKWWWFPEPRVPKPFWMHLDSIWSASSLVFLTFSGGLIADLATRVLSGGLDVWGSSTIIIQSLVTLIVGKSALTTRGQESVKKWLGERGFSRRWWDEGSLLVSVGLFILLLGFQSVVLPEFSKFYQCLGNADYAGVDGLPTCLSFRARSHMQAAGVANVTRGKAARLSSAEAMYKRALKLNPDYVNAHFALGNLYADLQDLNQARDAYEKAVKGGKLEAYDRLAQLVLNQKEPDHEQAMLWLSRGLPEAFRSNRHDLLYEMTNTLTQLAINYSLNQQKNLEDKDKYLGHAIFWVSRGLELLEDIPDDRRHYDLQRNFGWVSFRQSHLPEAMDALKAAIALNPLRPDAYCLRAQVQQQQLLQARQAEATEAIKILQENIVGDWNKCRTLTSPYPYDEDGEIIDPNQSIWHREAKKQLDIFSSNPSHSPKQYAEQSSRPQV